MDLLVEMGIPLTTRNWLEARYEDPDITWHEVDGDVETEMPDGLIEDRPGKPPGIFRHQPEPLRGIDAGVPPGPWQP